MKIRLVGAEVFHADGQTDGPTDLKKLTVTRNFANAPINYSYDLVHSGCSVRKDVNRWRLEMLGPLMRVRGRNQS
jgi:hypothetical protein